MTYFISSKITRPYLMFNVTSFTFLLVLFAFLTAAELRAQENYAIRKIHFKGNKAFDKDQLLETTSIYESNWYSRRIRKTEAALYHPEIIQADKERIRHFYQTHGFLRAVVKIDSVQTDDKKQSVQLHFSIEENEPIVVDKLLFRIDKGDSLTIKDSIVRAFLRHPILKEGSRFVDANLYADIEQINGFFMNRGHVYADTQFELKLQPDSNKTDVVYGIHKGDKGQFGEATVSGNRFVKEKVIRRQFNFKAGEDYSQKKLESTRRDMYGLQLFRVVSLSPLSDKATQRNPIPIKVYIQEMPRWSTRFGLGFGTEDKFRAFSDFTYRGLWGGTSRLNLQLKHSALTPYYASLSWIEPRFLMQNLSLSVSPYAKREAEPGYSTSTFGLNLPISYTFTQKTKATLSYYAERVTQVIESTDTDVPNPEDKDYLYNKSGLSMSMSLHNALPLVNPSKGWSLALGAKVNGYIFGSDFNYTRLWTDVRAYQKTGKFLFAERIMLGAIYSSDTSGFIPVEDRWYAGGSNSNRGWGRAEIGPQRESGTPSGGKSMLETNLEVRHPLFWRVELAAFVDASTIQNQSNKYQLSNMQMAVGGGLRINTPIGPIRFDVGMPVWNEKRKAQFFLSVGQAF